MSSDQTSVPRESSHGHRIEEWLASRRPAGLHAMVLIPFFFLVLVLSLKTVVPVSCLDDVTRNALSAIWSKSPYFFTWDLVWLPFPMMLKGAAFKLTGEVFVTSLVVSLVCTGLALVGLVEVTRRLFGPFAAWTAGCLFAFSPPVLWISLSALSEPVGWATLALGMGFALRAFDRRSNFDLAAASLSWGAVVLTRYELWPFGLAYSAWVLWLGWRARGDAGKGRRFRDWAIAGGLLPAALIAVWVGKNLLTYGQPVYGYQGRDQPTWQAALSLRPALLQALRELREFNAWLVLTSALGGLVFLRRGWLWVLAAGAQVGLLVLAYTSGRRPGAYPIRLAAVPLWLAAPLAGGLAAALARRSRLAGAAVVGLVGIMFWRGLAVRYPASSPSMTVLSRRLVQAGRLEAVETVFFEQTSRSGAEFYKEQIEIATSEAVPVRPLASGEMPWEQGHGGPVLVLGDGPAPDVRPPWRLEALGKVDEVNAWGVERLDR
jgi:dolichyl-phosphate-mannose-protein mannosyltransferase